MNSQEALRILLEDSILFLPKGKQQILSKLPYMTEADMQSLGRVLALEQKKRQLTEEQKKQIDALIQVLDANATSA